MISGETILSATVPPNSAALAAGLLRRRYKRGADDRNLIAFEQVLHGERVEPARRSACHDAARACVVRNEFPRRSWNFHQLFLRTAIMHKMHEAAHRFLWRFVAGHTRTSEQSAGFLRFTRAEPIGEDSIPFSGRRRNDRLRRFDAGSDACRAMQHQQGFVLGRFKQDSRRSRVALAIRIADDVDRIGMRPGRRQDAV